TPRSLPSPPGCRRSLPATRLTRSVAPSSRTCVPPAPPRRPTRSARPPPPSPPPSRGQAFGHVQTGTARMQHLPALLPQPAAGVGYPIRELDKSCSRPRGPLAHSRVLEVPRSNSFPASQHQDDDRPLGRRPPSLSPV